MKVYIYVALSICIACAAPVINENPNISDENMNPEITLKRFKGVLHLFAPDNWIKTFDEISEAGQKCMIQAAGDLSAVEIYYNSDFDRMKVDLESKCPEYAKEFKNFIDIVSYNVNSLPKNFVQAIQEWVTQMRQTYKRLIMTASNGQQLNQIAFRGYIVEFSKITAFFTEKLTRMTEAERQQISSVFPKLQPLFSGDHSVEMFGKLNALYENLGSGQFNVPVLQNLGKELKITLLEIWKQYSSLNGDGIKQASQLMGDDVNKIEDMLKSPTDGHFGADFEARMPRNVTWDQIRPELVNEVNKEMPKAMFMDFMKSIQKGDQNHVANVNGSVHDFK